MNVQKSDTFMQYFLIEVKNINMQNIPECYKAYVLNLYIYIIYMYMKNNISK